MRRYFGTDGIRRIANTDLSPEFVYKVAKAGAYVLSKHTDHSPIILIGRDTRISGNLIESAMTAGFLSYGANVLSVGVIPTPAIAYLTKKLNADASVVISASHNTFEFNGIKFFSNKGMKIPDELEEEIENIMDSDMINTLVASNEKIGISKESSSLADDYISFITGIFGDVFVKNLDTNFKVVIDTANGATYDVADKIFTKLGINHKIINNTPNGININDKCGSTHLEMLKDYVVSNNYSLGIAYDGDGDRCLLVDENGNTIDGDSILAISSNYLKEIGKLNKNTVVATVMSNIGLGKYAMKNGINLEKTNVGDRYVLEKMLEKGYNLGGEQSGHVIFSDYNRTGDGILTSLMILKILSEKHILLGEAASIVTIYPQVLYNAKVPNEKKNVYKDNDLIVQKIKKAENELKDSGRILIRPSGTEPVVRVMIEGENLDFITNLANEIGKLIEEKSNS